MNDLLNIITNLGVSAGIAVYLVYWITKKLNNHISELTKQLIILGNKIDSLNRRLEMTQVEV